MSEQPEQPSAAGDEHGADPGLATSGAITYLHVPATDVRQAAAFYRDVFSWHITNPDSDRPSFDTPNGHLSGAWLSAHQPATEPGLLPYIYVDDIKDMVARILDHGGEIVTAPFPEGLGDNGWLSASLDCERVWRSGLSARGVVPEADQVAAGSRKVATVSKETP